jgi:hypothetical protein
MTDSIRESIIGNIKTTLQTITKANLYNFDVAKVTRERLVGLNIDQFPSIVIIPGREGKTEEPIERYTARLVITLECWLQEHDESIVTDVNKFLADVEKALLVDYTRGGKAINTKLVSNQAFYNDINKPYGGVMIDIEIHYRHVYNDPYTLG